MFISKDDAKKRIKEIIFNNTDNELILVVGNKGTGKLSLMENLYLHYSNDKNVITANGYDTKSNKAIIKRAFIEGICKYINSLNICTNLDFIDIKSEKNRIIKSLKDYGITMPLKEKILKKNKFVSAVNKKLSNSTLEIVDLKMLYVDIASAIPLIIFSEYSKFNKTDINYFQGLHNDDLDAKVTFVIAVRTTFDSNYGLPSHHKFLKLFSNQKKVWIMPILPDLKFPTESSYNALSVLQIPNLYYSSIGSNLKDILFKNEYLSPLNYDKISRFNENGITEIDLFFMSIHQIELTDYLILINTISLVNEHCEVNAHFRSDNLIVHDNNYMLVDSVFYYLIMIENMNAAIEKTQNLFFSLILKLYSTKRIDIDYRKRNNIYLSFLNRVKQNSYNPIAQGFTNYFNRFIQLVKYLNTDEYFIKSLKIHTFFALRFLCDIKPLFTVEAIKVILHLFDISQYCTFLDLGFEILYTYFHQNRNTELSAIKKIAIIKDFLKQSLLASFRNNDLTLLDEIIQLELLFKQNNIVVPFYNPYKSTYVVDNNSKTTIVESYPFMHRHFLSMISSNQLEERNITMYNHDDRFAIITPMGEELAAIKTILENYRDDVYVNKTRYSTGVVKADNGFHNIVVCVLPKDRYNNTSAAIAATKLKNDFTDVSDIILCGIAGGVPYAVELGDVVVSTKGIIQYDLGGNFKDKFEIRDYSTKPCGKEILQDISYFESDDTSRIKSILDDINSKTNNKYIRPQKKIEFMALSDDEKIYEKHTRDNIDQIKVHYQKIGAANSVQRNHIRRDMLYKQHGVFAVEMEGAGVRDASYYGDFEYLVIRGICDFCDEYKDDIWHNYAAATAAAYAKALLESIPIR